MLTERYDAALGYAAALHRRQIRKGAGTPYLAHLLAVSALVIEHGGDEDQAIAALLHDAVEDQGGPQTATEIERRFGGPVAEIVMACTDSVETPKPDWRTRKERYIAAVPGKPLRALPVILADKLHNATAIRRDLAAVGPAVWTRFTGGRDGTLWYYRALASALGAAAPGPLARELDQTVATIAAAA